MTLLQLIGDIWWSFITCILDSHWVVFTGQSFSVQSRCTFDFYEFQDSRFKVMSRTCNAWWEGTIMSSCISQNFLYSSQTPLYIYIYIMCENTEYSNPCLWSKLCHMVPFRRKINPHKYVRFSYMKPMSWCSPHVRQQAVWIHPSSTIIGKKTFCACYLFSNWYC